MLDTASECTESNQVGSNMIKSDPFMNGMIILRLSDGDILVNKGSVRVFAKRRQCKGQLELGKEYLIMGKDGHTTDSDGM